MLLQLPTIQNYIISRITKKLSKELNTTVSIRHVNLELFDKIRLEKTLILDHTNDTLLYAGAMSVNITDWFFFKKNIELKYIGLTDALINTKRDTPEWNYQFIADYFGSGGSQKKEGGVNLDLKIVQLKNVRLIQADHWVGTDKYAFVGTLRLDAEQLDLNKKIINIRQISIGDPVYSQSEYDGLRPPKTKRAGPAVEDTSATEAWNSDNWKILARKVTIKNGKVVVNRDGNASLPPGVFDSDNIEFSHLNAVLERTKLDQDTLTTDIVQMSARERSGFEVKNLTSLFRMTPEIMDFTALNIRTGKSNISDHFSMGYHSFNEDMNDFIHKVEMTGDFDNAVLSTDDLAFFAPQTKNWKLLLTINGRVTGRVDNLSARDLVIKDNEKNHLEANASIRGLPDIDETFSDIRIKKLKTDIQSLSKIIPDIKKIKQPDLASLQNIGFSGSFTGYFSDFVVFGNLTTSLGAFNTDIQLKMPPGRPPVFSGKLATTKFDLGTFIDNEQLGAVAFNGSINGHGITTSTIDYNIQGNVQDLNFNNYDYRDITFQGRLKRQEFSGNVDINDPNFHIENLAGTFNFSDKNPFFNFNADILGVDFKNVGLTAQPLFLNGMVSTDFRGKNIDDFLGFARLYHANLVSGEDRLPFDTLVISSFEKEDSKSLSLKSNELDVSLTGNYKILELPQAFRLFLSRYYPAYIAAPQSETANQDFSFEINTRQVSDFVKLFYEHISGFDNSTLSGSVNILENRLGLDAEIPTIQLGGLVMDDIVLKGNGNHDTLDVNLAIGNSTLNDSTLFPQTTLEAIASNDMTNFHLSTPRENSNYSIDLSALMKTRENGFTLSLSPSRFFINGKEWTIQKDGEVILDHQTVTIQKFLLSEDGQKISIYTRPSSNPVQNDVYLDITAFDISAVVPYFLSYPKIEGSMTATVRITNPLPFDSSTIHFSSTINDLSLEDDTIGVIKSEGNYDLKSKSLYTSVEGDAAPYKFRGNILYQMQDSLSPVSGTFYFDRTEIHFLDAFLTGIAHDIQGNATGLLNITGQTKDPIISGVVTLNDASMVIDYTQCKYNLSANSNIKFNPDEIAFDGISILDKNNKTAKVSGSIRHQFFDKFSFNNLSIQTENNFQLLNTTAKDNDQFYGTVTGRAELAINGPASDIQMSIKGTPTDSSHIFIPISESAESGGLNYIDFIQFGQEMQVSNTAKVNANISVNMELTATPLATIDVILDETTGDIIKAQGSGKLIITAGTHDPLTIRGRYNIDGGQYTFNFQTFLQTPFTLQQGFIEWQGDPYEALLNIDAVYHAQNVNLNSIPTSMGFSNTQGDIDVIFLLRGTLKSPDPQFEFQFPFNNPLKSDPIASEYLRTRFQSGSSEMLNQVASLLLFNTFLTNDQGVPAANATGNFVGKTVGQLLSATLTSSLNTWLQRVLKTNTINLYTNINAADFTFQQSLNELPVQNLGKVGVRYAFHKNKYIFYLGSNLNYRANPGLATNNSDVFVTPDFSFEMLISPSGNLRVVGFNRSDLDPTSVAGITSRNRTGVQLSYRKDFQTFEEFFTGKNRKRKQQQAVTN